MLLEGPAGIGKTCLLDELCAEAGRRGFTVLRGSADEVDRQPLAIAMSALVSHVANVPDGEDSALVEWAIDALEHVATAGPVVVAADDLHWADDASIAWFRAVARRLGGLPLALAGALRPTPRPRKLDAAVARLVESGAWLLRVDALDHDEATELGARVAGVAPAHVARAVDSAGGNPFLIVELSRAIATGALDELEAPLPSPLRSAVLTRFAALAPEAIIEVRAAAVLGSRVAIDDVAALTETTVPTAISRLEAALEAGILLDRDGTIEFAHDLVQQAIYEDIPAAVRRAWHLQAARLLSERGGRPEAIALHERRAATGPDRAAYERVMSAYVQAARGSYPASAMDLVELALELAPDDTARHAAIAPLTNHFYRYGRSPEVEALAAPVLQWTNDAEVFAETAYGFGSALLQLNRVPEARAVFSRLVERQGIAPKWLIWGQVCLATCDIADGDLRSGVDTAALAASEAEKVGPSVPHTLYAATHAWIAIGNARLALGDVAGAIEAGRNAADVERRAYGQLGGAFCGLSYGAALDAGDDHEHALAVLQAGLRTSEASGLVMTIYRYHFEIAAVQYRAGMLNEALASAEAGVAACNDTDADLGILTGFGIAALVHLHHDEVGAAEAVVRQGLAEEERRRSGAGREWLYLAKAARHGVGAAEAWRVARRVGHTPSFFAIAPAIAALASGEGDHDVLTKVAAHAAPLRTSTGAGARAVELHCRALAAGDAALLVEAAEAVPHNRPLWRAAAAEHAAGSLLALGDRPSATEWLAQAAAVYDAIGAARDSSRVDGALRRAGVRRPRKRPPRPSTGWEALTPAELDVVSLVAKGLTNREVGEKLSVARSTVHTHLLHAFAKLGCTSRAQLAALVARHDADRAHRSAP